MGVWRVRASGTLDALLAADDARMRLAVAAAILKATAQQNGWNTLRVGCTMVVHRALAYWLVTLYPLA